MNTYLAILQKLEEIIQEPSAFKKDRLAKDLMQELESELDEYHDHCNQIQAIENDNFMLDVPL